MALIVENGTIVTGANTYVDIATVDEYAELRGLAWAGTDDEKQSDILNAMLYIDAQNYKGKKYTAEQSLQWPRSSAVVLGWLVDVDIIPSQLSAATCEAAIKQQSGDILPDLERGGSIKREKVDVLEVEYFDDANANTVYQTVNKLLAPLMVSSNVLVLA